MSKRKKIVLYVVGLLCCGFVAVWIITGQNYVVNAVDYVADKTGLYKPNANTKISVNEYTTFQSVPNVLWKAGETKVGLMLNNPKGNPVDMAPVVSVDCDDNGRFDDDEIVYNKNWNLDKAKVLAPGSHVDQIELSREIPKGEHAAQVAFVAYHKQTSQRVNGMTMDFKVKVE